MRCWPLRAQAGVLRRVLDVPFNPMGGLPWARAAAAACEVFEGLTRRYGRPGWGIEQTKIFGLEVPVREEVVQRTAFCDLLHFDRDERVCGKRYDAKVLLISGGAGGGRATHSGRLH